VAEPNTLGAQTDAIAVFLNHLDLNSARILDVGCGQGCDALLLARAGHDVTGIDLPPSSVAFVCEDAAAEGQHFTDHLVEIMARCCR
jgi:2-polyprenyl-3-methyl-5-hydroxy-6-metoxy-1,4-benzoquinol methylase